MHALKAGRRESICKGIIMAVNKKKQMLPIILILFVIIFNPPLIKGISFTPIVVGGAAIFELAVLINSGKILIRKEYSKLFRAFLIFFIYLLFASLTYAIFYSGIFSIYRNIMRTIGLTICLFIVSSLLNSVFVKKRFDLDMILEAYVCCGLIQGVISLLSFFVPKVRILLNGIMVRNVTHENIAFLTQASNGLRSFGFAANLFDVFGCTMSLIAIIAFHLALNKSIKYFLHFLVISFSGIVNSRTSIVLIGVGIIILLLNSLSYLSRKKLGSMIVLSVLLISMVGYGWHRLSISNSMSSIWIKSGIESIANLAFKRQIDRTQQGITANYFGKVIDDFLFVPFDSYGMIFGTGHYPSELIEKSSDVVYIQNIWLYGLIGSVLLYMAYYVLFKETLHVSTRIYKGMVVSFATVVFLFLVKNDCLGYSMPMLVIMPILLFSLRYGKGTAYLKISNIHFFIR